jgi:hypothetical protein
LSVAAVNPHDVSSEKLNPCEVVETSAAPLVPRPGAAPPPTRNLVRLPVVLPFTFEPAGAPRNLEEVFVEADALA